MIAISATDRKLSASMDLRFWKCPYFLITDGKTAKFIYNPHNAEESEASTQVVKLLKKEGVTQVLTGELNPSAKTGLDKNKIQVIMLSGKNMSLNYILGRVKKFTTADLQ